MGACGVISTSDRIEKGLVPGGRSVRLVIAMSSSVPAELVGRRGALPVVTELSSVWVRRGDAEVWVGVRSVIGRCGVIDAPA